MAKTPEKTEKAQIGFHEALRRIANTPKDAIVQPKQVVNQDKEVYNDKEATERPPPAVKKTT